MFSFVKGVAGVDVWVYGGVWQYAQQYVMAGVGDFASRRGVLGFPVALVPSLARSLAPLLWKRERDGGRKEEEQSQDLPFLFSYFGFLARGMRRACVVIVRACVCVCVCSNFIFF